MIVADRAGPWRGERKQEEFQGWSHHHLSGCPPIDVPPAGVFLWPRATAPGGIPSSLCGALCGQAPGQPAGPLWPPHESLHHVCCWDCKTYSRVPLPTPGAGTLTLDPSWNYCPNPNFNLSLYWWHDIFKLVPGLWPYWYLYLLLFYFSLNQSELLVTSDWHWLLSNL